MTNLNHSTQQNEPNTNEQHRDLQDGTGQLTRRVYMNALEQMLRGAIPSACELLAGSEQKTVSNEDG